MGDFLPEDGPLVQQIALSGAGGGRVSANCKRQLAPSGKGGGGWVLAAGFLRAGGWVGGSESRVFWRFCYLGPLKN